MPFILFALVHAATASAGVTSIKVVSPTNKLGGGNGVPLNVYSMITAVSLVVRVPATVAARLSMNTVALSDAETSAVIEPPVISRNPPPVRFTAELFTV